MTERTEQPLNKIDVESMIYEALCEHDRKKNLNVDKGLAELQSVMDEIETYTPLIEAYGPKFIEKCGPATRVLLKAAFKEILPVMLPVIRQEAKVVAQELCNEFFRGLTRFAEEHQKEIFPSPPATA